VRRPREDRRRRAKAWRSEAAAVCRPHFGGGVRISTAGDGGVRWRRPEKVIIMVALCNRADHYIFAL